MSAEPAPSHQPSDHDRGDRPSDRAPLSLPGRPRRVSRRGWFLAISAAIVVAVLIAAREILLPFILALVIAYVFTPSVLWLQRRGLPRWVAIVGIYAIMLGTIYGFGAFIAPRIAVEARALGREVPKMVRQVETEILPVWEAKIRALSSGEPPAESTSVEAASAPSASGTSGAAVAPPASPAPDEQKPALSVATNKDGSFDVEIGSGLEVKPTEGGGYKIEAAEGKKRGGLARAMHYVQQHYVDLVRSGVAVVSTVARGIFLFFMTLMLAAYMMLTHEQILGFFRGMVKAPARPDFDRLLVRIDRGLSGVVRGQLLICVVNGALTAVGFALIGLKYWPILSLVAAVGSLIPIFGSILSSVPAVAIGLTQSPTTAVLVLGWIVLIHQIEANFLNPKIIGDTAHLHPVLVVFVLLAGEHWFHAAGALLAVPTLSIAQSLFLHFREVADDGADDVELRLPPPPRV